MTVMRMTTTMRHSDAPMDGSGMTSQDCPPAMKGS